MGIAMVDGKPVIRKSGISAPKIFTTYKFKVLKGLFSRNKAISFNLQDAALHVDGKTFAEIAKEGLGPMSSMAWEGIQATSALHKFGPRQSQKVIQILKSNGVKI